MNELPVGIITGLIGQEFERLTGQQCFFLPGKDIESIDYGLEEGKCPAFCFEIGKSGVGHYLCGKKREALIAAAVRRKEPSVGVCHAGLYEIMVPAFADSEASGVFNACFAPPRLADNIRSQGGLFKQKYNCAEDILLEAVGRVAVMDENTIHSTANLLNALVLMHIHPAPPSMGDDGLLEMGLGGIEDSAELLTNPLLYRSLSQSIEQLAGEKEAYQASNDILQKMFSRIFIDIRTGKLVAAKETFKAIMNVAYQEPDLEKTKYAACYMIFQFNDSLLRKISFYKEVYELTVPILRKISRAGSSNEIRASATEYFDGLTQIYQVNDKNRNAIINRMVNYVNENYARPFTIKEMVKSLNVSASYSSRTFSEQMGVSIKWYINEIRMYHAQHLLRYTDWPVSTVAERVGYTDVRSFYKMFEKHFGISCSQLRRLYFNRSELQKEAER